MKTSEIRQRFLDHFAQRGHTVVPSAGLIADDPNLLFVNAGMVPFKPYFLGQVTPPYPRATSVQKCVRTLDIDEVGKTTRHGSFFQMNGNFSFGDYFKDGAIRYAWELVTNSPADGGYGFDESKLWVSVYEEDDEAFRLWRDAVGVPESRIIRLGKGPNFWSMGVPGPCGPCSEILIDRGPEYGPEYVNTPGVEPDGDRYLEFWNLVFMQYERGPGQGKTDYPILGDLPAQNIDTGMGMERVAFLLQGVDNFYEVDEVRPILDKAAQLSGKHYPAHQQHDGHPNPDDVRLRVVADHVRTALMLIGDGVTPGNEGRGYVLRRILRRAVRSMRLLGYEDPSFPELFPVARDAMSASYPEVETDYQRIAGYAYAEEDAFRATLRSGTTILDTAVAETKQTGGEQLSGASAFQLHDTYGFPIDLTLEMAAEQGLTVDEEGFRRLMAEQRQRAKADAQARKTGHADTSVLRSVLDRTGPTNFTGYLEVEREGRIGGIIGRDGAIRSGAGQGEEVEVVLDSTPFYAEGGGQQPDQGVIVTPGGKLEVFDVQQPLPGLIVHRGKVVDGEIKQDDPVLATIDVDRRRSISRAHTATHLIHTAIRSALGESATQAGSLNAPGRLRFDFNTPGAVPQSVLSDVEDEVNAVLLDDLEVRAFITSQAEARRIGAMALFGEKYGDEVRVVEVGEYARELCGGTHAARSGQLGVVKLLSEASIGSGVRRVEALVGLDAFRFLAKEHLLVSKLAEQFKAKPDELPDRVASVVAQLRDAERELEKLRAAAVLSGAGDIAAGARDVNGVAVAAVEAPEGTAGNDVRSLAQEIRGRLAAERPGVVAVAARANGKASLVVAVNQAARGRGISASALVKGALSGRGGGSDDLAQGGGVPADAAPTVLASIADLVAGIPSA
ncbi:alanine--tRNA ligase [Cryptosporangium minutisporangium]|uniref:Alanine--tRNA ligase n=1 Tax=Cryptosporangium minutisporangium TaxID=113569 RepID=A0ABP6SRD9_9ACTN